MNKIEKEIPVIKRITIKEFLKLFNIEEVIEVSSTRRKKPDQWPRKSK